MMVLGALMIFWGIYGASWASGQHVRTSEPVWLMLMVWCMLMAPMGAYVMAAGQ